MKPHSITLKFKSPYLSIQKFDDIQLPSFAALTGVNGAGKSHFLKAILGSHIIAEGIDRDEILYFDYIKFKIQATNSQAQQIDQLKTSAWNIFSGNQGNPKINCRGVCAPICNELLSNVKENVGSAINAGRLNIFADLPDNVDEKSVQAIHDYRTQVERSLFRRPEFRNLQQSKSMIQAIKKIGKPVSHVSEDAFKRSFNPSTANNNFLAMSLAAEFSRYVRDQYNYARTTAEDSPDRSFSHNQLIAEYTDKYRPPWEIMNELLSHMSGFSENEKVFKFQLSTPPDGAVTLSNFSTYIFNPSLIEQEYQTNVSFEHLSSGEQTLLALALAIYQSQENFESPKLLLLDEVDASLHPSMSFALVNSIQSAFVDMGTTVILATHSPSTLASLPDGTHFEVNKGNSPQKVTPISRNQAITAASDGFFSMSQKQMITVLGINLAEEGKPILFVEGQSDQKIITTAWERLKGDSAMPFSLIPAFDCFFLCNLFKRGDLTNNCSAPLFLGLIDFDSAFKDAKEKLGNKKWTIKDDPDTGIVKLESPNQVEKIITLPVPDFRKNLAGINISDPKLSIELLFPDSIVADYCNQRIGVGGHKYPVFDDRKKVQFSNNSQNLNASDFEEFRKIFDKIEFFISESKKLNSEKS